MLDEAEATIQDVDINLKISTLSKGHKNTKLSSSIWPKKHRQLI